MNATPQGGGFQVSFNLDFLVPVSEVHGVFSNEDLLTGSGRQPRAKKIAYNVLVVSWTIINTS